MAALRRGLFVALHHALARQQLGLPPCTACHSSRYSFLCVSLLWGLGASAPAAMSGFNLLHLITKSQPVALRPCSLPSGARRIKKTWPVTFSHEELKERLTPTQYHVTQERGTESAFTGTFTHHKDEGTYACVVCGASLFSSSTKFESGSGWPSFFDLMQEESIALSNDFSYGMHRVETTCSQCGAHLGHLFEDGPKPTGKRYCINSASLAFWPKDAARQSTAEEEAAGSSAKGKKSEF